MLMLSVAFRVQWHFNVPVVWLPTQVAEVYMKSVVGGEFPPDDAKSPQPFNLRKVGPAYDGASRVSAFAVLTLLSVMLRRVSVSGECCRTLWRKSAVCGTTTEISRSCRCHRSIK
jgi:hypothetical protein